MDERGRHVVGKVQAAFSGPLWGCSQLPAPTLASSSSLRGLGLFAINCKIQRFEIVFKFVPPVGMSTGLYRYRQSDKSGLTLGLRPIGRTRVHDRWPEPRGNYMQSFAPNELPDLEACNTPRNELARSIFIYPGLP